MSQTYGPVDLEIEIEERLAHLGFDMHLEEEQADCRDAIEALAECVILKRSDLLTLLNCAEADLLGLAADGEGEDYDAAHRTTRELHAKIKELYPGHKCEVDDWDEEEDEIGDTILTGS